jgi:hypothetical protein
VGPEDWEIHGDDDVVNGTGMDIRKISQRTAQFLAVHVFFVEASWPSLD